MLRVPVFAATLAAGMISDWATYAMTSLQLSSALHGDGSFWAMFAGVMAAFYRPFLFQGVFFLKETWLILALSLFVLAALRLEAARLRRDAFWSGLALGLAALSKGNVLLLAPVLPAALLLRKPARPGPGLAAVFLLGLALPILPATLHNYEASRDFVLINYTSGFSFFIGNNPESNGSTHYPLKVSSQPLEEEKQSTALAEAESGRTLRPSEVSRFYARKGLAFIRQEPGRWLRLTVFKFMLFWNKYELPDNYDLSFIQAHTKTLLSWPLFSFQWVASFAATGLVLLKGGRSLRVLGGLYMLSVVLTYVTDRYRLPMAVFLIPFAAGMLAELVRAEPDRLSQAAFLCGGAAAEKAGKKDEASTIYRAGLELHPEAALLQERRDRLMHKALERGAPRLTAE